MSEASENEEFRLVLEGSLRQAVTEGYRVALINFIGAEVAKSVQEAWRKGFSDSGESPVEGDDEPLWEEAD